MKVGLENTLAKRSSLWRAVVRSANMVRSRPTQLHTHRDANIYSAIQLARLSGFSPIVTTASLHNTQYLQSLGATHVLDRFLSKKELKERIVQICGDTSLLYAFDAISLEDTQRVAYDSLAPGGKFTEVRLQYLPRHDPASGKRVLHAWGSFEVTTPGVREFGQRFMRELSGWLAEGRIKVRGCFSGMSISL